MEPQGIISFLDRVRHRLNGDRTRAAAAASLLGAAGLAVAWALGWRIFGYAAPWWGYAIAAALGIAAAAILAIRGRRTQAASAEVADRVFGLKDGLLSWLDFRHHEGEAYQLHEKAVAARVATLDPQHVPVGRRPRLWTAGVALAALALGLSLIPHSDEVRERLAREALTSERTAEVKRQIEETVEELLDELTEEERKLVDPAKLRDLAAGIEQTDDAREAEKQLARFEAELSKAMQGLEARQDEAVLKLSAEELAKSSLADARQLGKELDAKDFEKAREKLGEMKPMKPSKFTAKELEELREKVEKTKEMAKRMADGARQREFGEKMDGKAARPAEGDQRPLQEMLEELDADARELDGRMAEGELMEGEIDPDAEQMLGRLEEGLDELGDRMGLLHARQKARDRLGRLRAGMAEARQFARGQAQTLGLAQSMQQGQTPGGKKPGTGSVESRRDERDEFKDNGNLAQLEGQPGGQGPSMKSVESAESGTGIAGRAAVDRRREYQRQMEALVRRDDIPEELKLGVREYFERVHEADE